MTWLTLLSLVAFFVNYIIAIVVLLRNPHAIQNKTFFWMMSFICLWNVIEAILHAGIVSIHQATILIRIEFGLILMIASVWYHFVNSFIHENYAIVTYIPALILLPFVLFTGLFIESAEHVWYGIRFVQGPLQFLLYIIVGLLMSVALVKFFIFTKKQKGEIYRISRVFIIAPTIIVFFALFDIFFALTNVKIFLTSQLATIIAALFTARAFFICRNQTRLYEYRKTKKKIKKKKK